RERSRNSGCARWRRRYDDIGWAKSRPPINKQTLPSPRDFAHAANVEEENTRGQKSRKTLHDNASTSGVLPTLLHEPVAEPLAVRLEPSDGRMGKVDWQHEGAGV